MTTLRSAWLLTTALLCFGRAGLSPAGAAAQEATDYAAHFNRGQESMQQMKFHDAASEFREAARLNPDYLPAQQALAVAYAVNQNFAMAWRQIRHLRQSKVDLPEEFVRRLRESLSESEADKQLQKIDSDLASAQKSAAEHPEDPALQAAWGTALGGAGDYAAALRAAERALVLDSTQPEAHFLLGSMLGGEPPNSEQAIPHLKMYLQHVPHTPENAKNITRAYAMLGDIYGRSGREKQALEAYEEGIKTATDEDELWNNASWIYSAAQDASLRNPQKALAYARKAVAMSNGKKAHILDSLGEALYANGLFDEAVATEKKAIALEPGEDIYADQLKKFQAAKDQAKP